MNHIGLFEGIGGFSLAASWMDWETIAWCEWNPFGQKVLKYYFPKAIGHGDITKTDFTIYRGQCGILTGGFPCQPFSVAGNQGGVEDDRHIWPEMRRAIREIQPSIIVAENVAGLFTVLEPASLSEMESKEIRLFSQSEDYQINATIERLQRRVIATIIEEIRAEGYVLPTLADGTPIVCCIPACAVNAPHRRDRVWFVAFKDTGRNGCGNGEHEKQGSFGKFGEFSTGSEERDFGNQDESVIAHTNGSGGKEPKQQQPNLPTKSGRRNTETAVNPASQGREKREPNNGRTDSTEDRTGMDDRFERFSSKRIVASSGLLRQEVNELQTTGVEQCDKGNVTNPCNQGLQGSKVNGSVGSIGQERNKQLAGCVPSTWENFPTQPPICCRNDGLSSGLVGITVSKHRNESIKAYGNAIVPQVALQIFKAIEAMRTDFDKQ
jgi:DNA (cytosine-5)-methyltransferase 1